MALFHLDGASSSSSFDKVVNLEFEKWVTADLLLLGWLYNSITPEVAVQLLGFNNAKDLWEATQELFGFSQWQKRTIFARFFKQLENVTRKWKIIYAL
ncbi:hypothetical protein Csa_007135 [Cucumis sativus]|uniref:Retrotransposon gag domain-containing protein n=1 Tax=Cucumis sativus TaxID=3659 RepID=A0A0A0M380_CUCSA|nr:hypothetical protein Csa_007135 [Cucumis sativus]